MATVLPLPKYHQIYLVLREQLHEGRFVQGLPPEMVAYLAGPDDHGHHEHGDQGGEAHTCQLGHMLAAAAAVDHSEAVILTDTRPLPPVLLDYEFTSRSINHYRSRGPPS